VTYVAAPPTYNMGIEIVVGLPHLNEGPILERARQLQQPVLISANALSFWARCKTSRQWAGWRLDKLANARGLASLDLDSAGFVAMSRYGGFPWSVDDYFRLAAAFPFRRIAGLDYCAEHEIARDREEVLDRIARTVRANRDCRQRASDLGLLDRFMPVLQGRHPSDYDRCADALWSCLRPGAVVGVGSMCRRRVSGPEGLIAVVEHLDRTLPADISLHLFGVKGTALTYLKAFSHRVTSIDSQAYGIASRRDAWQRKVRKTDVLVADHLERWTKAQLLRLSKPPRILALPIPDIDPPTSNDPWEQAISQARAEIRELIESGDLSHDEITTGWIEQWAAGIYRPGSVREGRQEEME